MVPGIVVITGQGTRLFVGDEPLELEVASATGFRSGFADLVYRPR